MIKFDSDFFHLSVSLSMHIFLHFYLSVFLFHSVFVLNSFLHPPLSLSLYIFHFMFFSLFFLVISLSKLIVMLWYPSRKIFWAPHFLFFSTCSLLIIISCCFFDSSDTVPMTGVPKKTQSPRVSEWKSKAHQEERGEGAWWIKTSWCWWEEHKIS